MKANEFVKKFGWDEMRKQIKKPTGIYGAAFDYQFMGDLKRLVESYELIEQYNGLFEAKELIRVSPKMTSELRELAAAIADVESCQ